MRRSKHRRPRKADPDIICPYCGSRAEKALGIDIYPNRPDIASKSFWLCRPCWAFVGCHEDGRSLGNLANATLRGLRKKSHAYFDPIWKCGHLDRTEAYEWLASQLGISVEQCHMGLMNEDQCRKTIEVCKARE